MNEIQAANQPNPKTKGRSLSKTHKKSMSKLKSQKVGLKTTQKGNIQGLKKQVKFPQLSKRARKVNMILNTRGKKVKPNELSFVYKDSTKRLRMKAYENARKDGSLEVGKLLPQLAYRRSPSVKNRLKKSLTQKSLENLMNISRLNESAEHNESGEEGEEEADAESEDKKLDKSKYKFLNQATGYSIDQLNSDEKEDSFMQSTKPLSTIVNYLGLFKGLFTQRSLEVYYYEALFILEQDYSILKKTLMINEVINLALAIIKNEMFPSDTFMPNLFSLLFQGIRDVIKGEIKVVYPKKLFKKVCQVFTVCVDKEKVTNIETIEHYFKFFEFLRANWEAIPAENRNLFIGNFIDFLWFFCSDFIYYIKRKEDFGSYKLAYRESPNQALEFFLTSFEEIEDQKEELILKVQRLVYMGVEMISDSWDEDTNFSQKEKKLVAKYFEMVFICMKCPISKQMAFTELKQQCMDGVFTIFDRYFMLITKQSHPLTLERDFGVFIQLCVNHWKDIFLNSGEDDPEVDELKLAILIQINMILYQIIKSFNLNSLTHYIVDYLIALVKASIELIHSVHSVRRRKEFTKDIRVSFDEILAKINFSRVPKRFEDKMTHVNELIVVFLNKIDGLKSAK